MKKERKLGLLRVFPPVPEKIMAKIGERKRVAQNFVVFLTNGDELFARCYHQYYDGRVAERQRYVFAKDGCCRYGLNSADEWVVRSEIREPVFTTSYGYCTDNTYTALNMDAIYRSCMRYSCADKYHGTLLMEYLKLYLKHPNIEYLMKSGYENTIEGNEYSGYYWNVRLKIAVDPNVNLKSNNLLKMLGLSRTEFKALSGSEYLYDAYVKWREKYPKYKPQELISLARVFGAEFGTAERITAATGARILRITRYLTEQAVPLHDYTDYINQCRELSYNLRDTAICMPHDFAAMHTRLSEIIECAKREERRREREKRREVFAENFILRKRLAFSSGGYLIRQPESMDEIIAEGRALSHCVGGYTMRHAEGKLHILFIRRTDDPDTPLYTMELSTEGRVVQVRGYKNSDPEEGAKAFVEEYKQYIAPLFERQEVRITA